MNILISLALIGVVAALAAAGLFMLKKGRDGQRQDSMAKALAVRVAVSIGLFLLILFSAWMGWIKPTGVPMGQ